MPAKKSHTLLLEPGEQFELNDRRSCITVQQIVVNKETKVVVFIGPSKLDSRPNPLSRTIYAALDKSSGYPLLESVLPDPQMRKRIRSL